MSQQPPDMPEITLKVVFSGGLENLFSSQPSHPLVIDLRIPALVPADNSTTGPSGESPSSGEFETKIPDITYLIHHLRDKHLKERVELFMENGTVRPGILVLVNDTDWELEGEGEYQLKPKDEIVFISTLHGG